MIQRVKIEDSWVNVEGYTLAGRVGGELGVVVEI